MAFKSGVPLTSVTVLNRPVTWMTRTPGLDRRHAQKQNARGLTLVARGAGGAMVSGIQARLLVVAVSIGCGVPATDVRAEDPMKATPMPPLTIGTWTRPAEARRVEPAGIFDYMDGGGELYLAYRFDHIDVYEYAPRDTTEDAILVEVYALKGSDDAYGLLSQDWGGEPVALGPDWPTTERRALYGAGLLRVWTDDVYLRVMAYRETPAARDAVLAIARALVTGRPQPPAPRLVGAAPPEVATRWRVRLDRHVYLRSHLVLNSAHFLATANILDLGLETEAVLVPYADAQGTEQAPRVHLLLIRYADDAAARTALGHFREAYLPEAPRSGATERGLVKVEDGWTGWRLSARTLAIALAAPTEADCEALLSAAATEAGRMGS
jgi:hypothetical protein